MDNIKINKDLLLSLYIDKVNEIAEDLPEKTFFKIEEVVSIISDIIENNPNIIQNEIKNRKL